MVRLDENWPPGVVLLHLDMGWRPEPRGGGAVIVDEDDPSVFLISAVICDSVTHDSGAPRQVSSIVEGTGVEPDLDAWGVDL